MINERERGTRIVHENDIGSVISTGRRIKRIATGNLTGCTALALVLEKGPVKEAYIQHFNRPRKELGKIMLKQFVDSRQAVSYDRSRAVILAPGTSANRWHPLMHSIHRPYHPEEAEELDEILTHLPSSQHDTRIVAYPNILRVPHSVLVELPRHREVSITVSRAGVPTEIPLSAAGVTAEVTQPVV